MICCGVAASGSKYGTLRIGWSGSIPPAIARKVDDAIALAEARSAFTCETCGAEGRLHSLGGWSITVCLAHAIGETVPVDTVFKNFHVVWVYDRRVATMVSCRRYVRETDGFLDVDPASLDIED